VHAVPTYLDLEAHPMTTTTTAPAPLGNTPTAPVNPLMRTADDFADFPRDQWDRPLIVQLDEAGAPIMVWDKVEQQNIPLRYAYTRASRAGSALEYEGALNAHHIRTTVIGLTLRDDLYYLAKSIAEPGGAGRRELDRDVIKPAQSASGADTAKINGTVVHSFAEKLDRGELVPALGPHQSTLDAYAAVTRGWTWHAIEARLISDRFRMAGKADRIGSPPGFLVAPDGTIITPDDRLVLDLKTSSSARYFGVKFAVQLCVYAYGAFYDLATFVRTPTGVRTDWALVIHVPSGGSSGALYWVNLRRGVELTGLAREVLDAQGERGLVTRVADGAMYATLEEAQAAAAQITGGDPAGVTVAMPAADAAELDPEPPAGALPQQPAPVDITGATVVLQHELEAADVAAAAEVTGESELEVEARGNGSTVPASVTAAIRPDLGPSLQRAHAAASDPRVQVERELEVIRQSGITDGGTAAHRGRLAAQGRWTDEHEAVAQQRDWELGIIAALQSCTTETALRQIADQVVGWGRWTPEMRLMARRQSAAINATGDEG
jgi:hypothetical protein